MKYDSLYVEKHLGRKRCMMEQIIVALMVVVVAIFIFIVFKDGKKRGRTNSTATEKEKNNKTGKKIDSPEDLKKAIIKTAEKLFPNKKHGIATVPAHAPTVYVRVPNQEYYVSTKVDKIKFTIGRDPDNDIVLDDETVSGVHAEIVRFKDRTGAFYYFHNLKPINPTEYYDQEINDYVVLKNHEKIDLEEKEAFYIGEYKIIIETPQVDRIVSDDELEVKKQTENTYKQENYKKKSEDEIDPVAYRRQIHAEKLSTQRIVTKRNVSEDELNYYF